MRGDTQYVLNADTGEFYSGTASLLPSALHSSQFITTVIFNFLFFFFNREWLSSISYLVPSFLFEQKGGGKILLKIEALEVLISEGLGLFQVTVEV